MSSGGQRRQQRGTGSDEVRPAVWLFAIICVGACVLTIYLVAGASDIDEGPEVVQRDDGPADRQRDARRRWRREADMPSYQARSYDPDLDPALIQEDDGPDPQMEAMDRWAGPADAGVALHFNPTTSRGQIASIEGLPLATGTECSVRVLPIQTYGFSCMIRVVCDGLVLYPDPEQGAGYVACDVEDGRPTTAIDDGYTFADGDPTVHFDRQRRRVTISDDGPGVPHFRAEIELGRQRFL